MGAIWPMTVEFGVKLTSRQLLVIIAVSHEVSRLCGGSYPFQPSHLLPSFASETKSHGSESATAFKSL